MNWPGMSRLADLPTAMRTLIEEDLAIREFTPTVARILKVSTFSTPSTWDVKPTEAPPVGTEVGRRHSPPG